MFIIIIISLDYSTRTHVRKAAALYPPWHHNTACSSCPGCWPASVRPDAGAWKTKNKIIYTDNKSIKVQNLNLINKININRKRCNILFDWLINAGKKVEQSNQWVTPISCQSLWRSPNKWLTSFRATQKVSRLGFYSTHLGRMIFSLGCSQAKSLKVLNLMEGGWRKDLAPKLNSHCW